MMRICSGVLVLMCTLTPALHAQQGPPPSVMIAHTTPKAIGAAMLEVLQPQKFKVAKASKGRIVLSQNRGNVAQATGEVMRVRLEMVFAVEQVGDSLKITATSETYYADRGPMGEQARSVDVNKERQNFELLLNATKERIEHSSPADSAGT